jgi:hypothetical protein
MALTSDEIAQIRDVVRLEIRQNTSASGGKIFAFLKIVVFIGLALYGLFFVVLALHVLVIGGFTVWHLLLPSS